MADALLCENCGKELKNHHGRLANCYSTDPLAERILADWERSPHFQRLDWTEDLAHFAADVAREWMAEQELPLMAGDEPAYLVTEGKAVVDGKVWQLQGPGPAYGLIPTEDTPPTNWRCEECKEVWTNPINGQCRRCGNRTREKTPTEDSDG